MNWDRVHAARVWVIRRLALVRVKATQAWAGAGSFLDEPIESLAHGAELVARSVVPKRSAARKFAAGVLVALTLYLVYLLLLGWVGILNFREMADARTYQLMKSQGLSAATREFYLPSIRTKADRLPPLPTRSGEPNLAAAERANDIDVAAQNIAYLRNNEAESFTAFVTALGLLGTIGYAAVRLTVKGVRRYDFSSLSEISGPLPRRRASSRRPQNSRSKMSRQRSNARVRHRRGR